jgi:hypothetical protein
MREYWIFFFTPGSATACQVDPPSPDRCKPASVAARTWFGWSGWIDTSQHVAPMRSVQLSPPSIDSNRPLVVATNRCNGLFGSIASAKIARPISVADGTCFQVNPPSDERNRPMPCGLQLLPSPVPA